MARAIPDDNLAYPVLLSLADGGSGSGFFLNTAHSIFLVTAKHVLFDSNTGVLASPGCKLVSYAKDPAENTRNEFQIDLQRLSAAGQALAHPTVDVAVVRIGTKTGQVVTFLAGVTAVTVAPSGILGVGEPSVRRFAEVLVANEVFIFGYPTSIGLRDLPQIDYARPLLRKGIIAGKNDGLRTLILDCPVYWGNSGGPVLEVETEGFEKKFRVVGVVSQLIPLVETWKNETQGYKNIDISNSGYSVALPMDPVMELVALFAPPQGNQAA